MICPTCKTKLKCQESRQTDNYTRIREYGCPKCNVVFNSLETLDKDPVDKAMQKVQLEYVKKSLERGGHD